jgi:hypothetical protein
MTVRLYKHGQRYEMRKEHGNLWYDRLTTSEAWQSAMSGFSDRVRYEAANLAAHNWDVTLIGERLLISCAWSGGRWYAKDGTSEPMSDADKDQFYPRCEEQPEDWTWNEWQNRTTNQDGVRRCNQFNLEENDHVRTQEGT